MNNLSYFAGRRQAIFNFEIVNYSTIFIDRWTLLMNNRCKAICVWKTISNKQKSIERSTLEWSVPYRLGITEWIFFIFYFYFILETKLTVKNLMIQNRGTFFLLPTFALSSLNSKIWFINGWIMWFNQ